METSLQSRVSAACTPRAIGLWKPNGKLSARDSGVLLAASMICADPLHIERELRLLEEGKVNLLHIDVMDGTFVPRLGLGPELVMALREATELPIDIHLMLSDLERYIPVFAEAGADIIIIHAEASIHLPRLLNLIRQCGARPGLALNPGTSLNTLDYVLDDVDVVLLMTINPGCVGEEIIPAAMRKIDDVHRLLGGRAERIHIMVDGNVNLDNAPDMIRSGATVLVCGFSSIFGEGGNVRDGLEAFRRGLVERVGR